MDDAGKEPVFPARVTGRMAFSAVFFFFGREQAAFHVAYDSVPLVVGVGHGLPEQVLGRDVVDTLVEDGPNRFKDRNRLFPAFLIFSSGHCPLILCSTS